jgi:hypothetical protein
MVPRRDNSNFCDSPTSRLPMSFVSDLESLDEKQLTKLHLTFGHPRADTTIMMFEKAGLKNKSVKDMIRNVYDKCQVCRKWDAKHGRRPRASLPKYLRFLACVRGDLMFIGDLIILHIVDQFSRFSFASIIANKLPSTMKIAPLKTLFLRISPPELIIWDGGGEFLNDGVQTLCEAYGVRVGCTAGESHWAHGGVERHHHTLRHMFVKVREDMPKTNPKLVLAATVLAKNITVNYLGQSPYQIVYGHQPYMPDLATSSVSSLQFMGNDYRDIVGEYRKAIELARSAYYCADVMRKVTAAVVAQTYRVRDFKVGDDVMFYRAPTKKGEYGWRGPAKVISLEGDPVNILMLSHGGYVVKAHPLACQLDCRLGSEGIEVRLEETPPPGASTAEPSAEDQPPGMDEDVEVEDEAAGIQEEEEVRREEEEEVVEVPTTISDLGPMFPELAQEVKEAREDQQKSSEGMEEDEEDLPDMIAEDSSDDEADEDEVRMEEEEEEEEGQRGNDEGGGVAPLNYTIDNGEDLNHRQWVSEDYAIVDKWRDKFLAFAAQSPGWRRRGRPVPTADSFASLQNRRFRRYWDRHQNAFYRWWFREVLWVNPPFSVWKRVVDKLRREGVLAYVICPMWEDQEWYRRLEEIKVDEMFVPKKVDLYFDSHGRMLPQREWRTKFMLVDGKLSSEFKETFQIRGNLSTGAKAKTTEGGGIRVEVDDYAEVSVPVSVPITGSPFPSPGSEHCPPPHSPSPFPHSTPINYDMIEPGVWPDILTVNCIPQSQPSIPDSTVPTCPQGMEEALGDLSHFISEMPRAPMYIDSAVEELRAFIDDVPTPPQPVGEQGHHGADDLCIMERPLPPVAPLPPLPLERKKRKRERESDKWERILRVAGTESLAEEGAGQELLQDIGFPGLREETGLGGGEGDLTSQIISFVTTTGESGRSTSLMSKKLAKGKSNEIRGAERYEPQFLEAVKGELESWNRFEAVERVESTGNEKTVGSRMLYTYKDLGGGKRKAKARLVAQGFQDPDKDSLTCAAPTAHKSTFRLVLAICATEQWAPRSIDIKTAFLQGMPITRDVFLRPPPRSRRKSRCPVETEKSCLWAHRQPGEVVCKGGKHTGQSARGVPIFN